MITDIFIYYWRSTSVEYNEMQHNKHNVSTTEMVLTFIYFDIRHHKNTLPNKITKITGRNDDYLSATAERKRLLLYDYVTSCYTKERQICAHTYRLPFNTINVLSFVRLTRRMKPKESYNCLCVCHRRGAGSVKTTMWHRHPPWRCGGA